MSGDLIAVLSEDHRAVERVFDELQGRQGGPAQRSALAQQVIIDLVRHAVAEERYLYPLVRRELPDGDARAAREISEHTEAERVMGDLEVAVEADEDRFETLLAELIGQVRSGAGGIPLVLDEQLRPHFAGTGSGPAQYLPEHRRGDRLEHRDEQQQRHLGRRARRERRPQQDQPQTGYLQLGSGLQPGQHVGEAHQAQAGEDGDQRPDQQQQPRDDAHGSTLTSRSRVLTVASAPQAERR